MNQPDRWCNWLNGIAAAMGLALFLPLTAFAQSSSLEGEDQEMMLEEVFVTARKRPESLQEVAMSVSAAGQQEIDLTFATDIRNLVYISPNTLLDDTNQGPGGVAAAYIRGIGVSEVEKNFDPAVGVVIDGVFLGSLSGGIARSIDLQRVEILRGPQGTLFGRNTIGGVINLERTRPTMEFGGKIGASYGNYDTTTVEGVLNFGNSDSFGIKLTGAYRDQGEGYMDNSWTGFDEGWSDYTSFGINPLFVPMEGLEIELTYYQERTDQDSPPLLNVGQPGQLFCDAFGYCSPNVSTPVSGDRYITLRDCGSTALPGIPDPNIPWNPPGYDAPTNCSDATFDVDSYEAEVRWSINDQYSVDYIWGRWESDETVVNDWDAVESVLFHTNRPADYEQTTNELRLTYGGENLDYTVGLYHWDSEYNQTLNSYIGFIVPGIVLDIPQFTTQTSKSKAIFFEGDYSFSNPWTLTLGGRWTDDKKTTNQTGNVTGSASASWSEFTPKVAIKYQIDDASMVYGLYSVGYRAGGFNGRVDSLDTALIPYDPETVDNWELGYRSEWANRTVIFNATAFYMEYKDKQEEIQQPSSTSGTGQVTRVVNAASATITGGEFELIWAATESLTLRANLGLLDASYDNFLVNTGTADNPMFTDFSGLDFRRAPKTTASVSGDYLVDVGSGDFVVRAGARYVGPHEVDFANKPELHNSSQILVDGSINYIYENWSFSLFGRNLTDEDGYQIGFDVAGLWSYAAPRVPRTYGFEVGYSF